MRTQIPSCCIDLQDQCIGKGKSMTAHRPPCTAWSTGDLSKKSWRASDCRTLQQGKRPHYRPVCYASNYLSVFLSPDSELLQGRSYTCLNEAGCFYNLLFTMSKYGCAVNQTGDHPLTRFYVSIVCNLVIQWQWRGFFHVCWKSWYVFVHQTLRICVTIYSLWLCSIPVMKLWRGRQLRWEKYIVNEHLWKHKNGQKRRRMVHSKTKAVLSVLFWETLRCKRCRNEWMNRCNYFCPFFYSTHTDSQPLSLLCPVLEFQEKCHCSKLIALLAVDHWGFCEPIIFFLILWPRACVNASPAVLYRPWRRFCSSAQSLVHS